MSSSVGVRMANVPWMATALKRCIFILLLLLFIIIIVIIIIIISVTNSIDDNEVNNKKRVTVTVPLLTSIIPYRT